MEKVWEVLDDETGIVTITVTADTTTNGVTISNTPNWHNPMSIDRIVTLLENAKAWLAANFGA